MTTTIATKTCGRCGRDKSVEDFSKSSVKSDGRQSRCKQCAKEVYWENRDDSIIKKRQYNKENREDINAKGKIYRKQNPEKTRARRLKYMYNITIDQYNKMLEAQNHVCAICFGKNDNTGYPLFVDHDHSCCPGGRSCGKCVRGLLCNDCNFAIGAFKDNPDNFDKAKEYILEFRA